MLETRKGGCHCGRVRFRARVDVRRIMRYSGGHTAFRKRCDAVTADGYREPSSVRFVGRGTEPIRR